MLFAGNRVLKLVFRNRVVQVFLLVVVVLLLAKYAYSPFVLFILINPVFVSNYVSIVGTLYTFFDVYLCRSNLSSFLFFFFWLSWIWVPLMGVVLKTRRSHLKKIVLRSEFLNRFTGKKDIVPGVFCILSLVLILILYSYRYFVYPIPQGWDTMWYLESLRSIKMDFLGVFSSLKSIIYFPVLSRPLYFLVLYSVSLVVGCEEVALMVLPLIFAILYAFATYEFVFVGTGDRLVAGLAMVLASLSYFTVRISFDLYNTFLGLIIVLLCLTVLMKIVRGWSKWDLLLGCVLFLALALTHAWTWMVFVVILVFYLVVQFFRGGKNFQKTIYATALVMLPSVILVLAIFLVAPTLLPPGWFTLFSFPASEWYYVSRKESPFLLIPAIYGLYVVFTKNTHFTNLLLAWVIALSLLVFITGTGDSYRFYILYPLGILATFGAYDIIGRVDSFLHKRFSWKRRGILLYVLVPVLFCLLVFSSTLPGAFDGIYLQRPNGLAMMQVYWIYWVYGYNNPYIIVLVYDPPAGPLKYSWNSNIEGFARAYIGFDSIYFGNLTSLLLGCPDSYGRTFDISNRTIILTSELYRLTPLELSMSKEVNCLGIYIVTSTNNSNGCLNFAS